MEKVRNWNEKGKVNTGGGIGVDEIGNNQNNCSAKKFKQHCLNKVKR